MEKVTFQVGWVGLSRQNKVGKGDITFQNYKDAIDYYNNIEIKQPNWNIITATLTEIVGIKSLLRFHYGLLRVENQNNNSKPV